jgi:DNA invertase Pin-like site-specific DNA recombinase
MASRCVVYMRTSTPSQSTGSSFVRQLESCTRAADLFGLYVKAVFADTCSGDGAMPSRSMAYLTAKQLDCPILVESQCRWSRKLPGTDPLVDVEVLVVGDGKRVLVDRIFGNHLSVVMPSQRYLP